jgi:hypothetical protein
MRKAVASLALACAGLQVAPAPALLATVLMFVHADGHGHTVSLVAAEGHAHVVLSHGEHEDQAPATHHSGPISSSSESDHVFDLMDADATTTAPRRGSVSPAAAIATPLGILPLPAPPWVRLSSPIPRSVSSDLLRTVVLRL